MSLDKRTNRLLIRDNQTVVETLQRWAAQMDIPVEQVELAAHIVTINEKSLRELGVKWNLADAADAGKVGQLTTLGSDLSVASATSHVGLTSDGSMVGCWIWSSLRWSKTAGRYHRQPAAAGLAYAAGQHQAGE